MRTVNGSRRTSAEEVAVGKRAIRRDRRWLAGATILLLWTTPAASAQELWTPEQKQVLAAMERLSAATAPGGEGADAYGAVLSEDFGRWTVGSDVVNDKEAWVEGVREWFDDGWRVAERRTRNLEILIRDGYAFTRRIVEETYRGPEGESSTSKAALAEVWIRDDRRWLLLLVNVHPVDDSG